MTPAIVFPPKKIAQILFQKKSEFQDILLTREKDGTLQLTLDGFWQFHSDDEYIYHEVLTDAPAIMVPRLDEVAILGGGDGLALRNILRYAVGRAVLCELDPVVIDMAKTVPAMRSLTEGSFDDPRAHVVIADAREFVLQPENQKKYDLVISDFPASTNQELKVLFSHEFYLNVSRILRPDGILSIQVSQQPRQFWQIYTNIAQIFGWAVPLLVRMGVGDDGTPYWANYIFAGWHAPTKVQRPLAKATKYLSVDQIPRLIITKFDERAFFTDEYPNGYAPANQPETVLPEAARDPGERKKESIEYHRKLLAWHDANFFPFLSRFTKCEREYLETCFSLAVDEIDDVMLGRARLSYYTYSHRVAGNEVNSSRIAYGSLAHPAECLIAAGPVLRERQVTLDELFPDRTSLGFYGLGWDFVEDLFKIYFRCSDLKTIDESFRALAPRDLSSVVPQGLLSVTLKAGVAVERKVYSYPRADGPETPVLPVTMATSTRGEIAQSDVKETRRWLRQLNDVGRRIVLKYEEIDELLDTIAYADRDHFTLYFP